MKTILICCECEKVFSKKVTAGSSPRCPRCGSTDIEPAQQ